MPKKLSRRTLLRTALLASGGTLVACAQVVQKAVDTTIPKAAAAEAAAAEAAEAAATQTNFFPLVQKPAAAATPTTPVSATPTVVRTPLPPGSGGRVVHVHANDATNWNLSAQDYWNYVNQTAVDRMVDQGVMNLTGQHTMADAWRSLIPNYGSGQVVAIKVSFNNCHDVGGSSNEIDGIIEPVNAIIRGLKAAGVSNSSIVVYDSSRVLPTRFTSKCTFQGVQFKDRRDSPWGTTKVTFTPPNMSSYQQSLSNVVAGADYLINVPIMKMHGMTKVSLAMKNHYGSISDPLYLHDWSSTGGKYFSAQYNPIVDINKNSHIAGKTILTLGDGIFAAFSNYDPASFPKAWKTFNNQTPKSLFFSADPVAIDCIMSDWLNAERMAAEGKVLSDKGYIYLQLAADAGLGTYERGDPTKNTYTKIDYQRIEA